MARPRVFVSSTYYDLKHVRNNIELFLEEGGYEAVLFESGDISFDPQQPLDVSCYDEVEKCDIFVLIVGGHYGSLVSKKSATAANNIKQRQDHMGKVNSITSEEYRRARDKDIPIYIFLERNVAAEYKTYLKNKNKKINFAHVDSDGVYRLLDEIFRQERNNFVKEFDRASDITDWLRDQWAGLFAQLLKERVERQTLADMSDQMQRLQTLVDGLKGYSELILKRSVTGDDANKLIRSTQQKINKGDRTLFFRLPMISYLRSEAKEKGIPAKSDEWYAIFEKSKDLEDFLAKVGFDEVYIKEFLGRHERVAKRDYKKYKARFFDEDE